MSEPSLFTGHDWLSGLEGSDKHYDAESETYAPYKDQAGIWTVGHGRALRDAFGKHARGEVAPKAQRAGISKRQADDWFTKDLAAAERAIHDNVKVPLGQRHYDALVSFIYNTGAEAFVGSTLLEHLNEGDYDAVPGELERWKFVTKDDKKIESKGLSKLRAAEIEMWRSETYNGQE